MEWDWNKKYNQLKELGRPFVITTIVKADGSAPRGIGAKMIVTKDHEDFRSFGTVGGGKIEFLVIEDAKEVMNTKRSITKSYALDQTTDQMCGGSIEVFLEFVIDAPKLYLFGAGHVGNALCRVLKGSPFEIHLIDERKEWVMHKELPLEVIRYPEMYDTFIEKANWNKESVFIAIMTYGHAHDKKILEKILKKDFKYLGLMGSASKWKHFQNDLLEDPNANISKKDLEKVTCPIGDRSVGEGPTEIAISIACEILKIYNS